MDTEFLKRSNNEQDIAWTREHLLDLVKESNLVRVTFVPL